MVYYDMDGQVSGSDVLMAEICPKPLSGNKLKQRDCKQAESQRVNSCTSVAEANNTGIHGSKGKYNSPNLPGQHKEAAPFLMVPDPYHHLYFAMGLTSEESR